MSVAPPPSTPSLRETSLADWHRAHGGRMVDFAGWSMPVQYGSIVEEHVATRTAVGLFDVSHMGRVAISGPAAEGWLDALLTRRVAGTPVGRVRYSLVTNESGGVLDDILFARVGDDRFDLVVNASNRAKLLDWFAKHSTDGVALNDRTERTAMIAVQGPKAIEAVVRLADTDVGSLRYYRCGKATVAGVLCDVSRTGYTGEDGVELVCDAGSAETLWKELVEAGGAPCGLASRDTLRLEAGMPLYGHELSEDRTPLDAGLGFAVDLGAPDGSRREFVGSAALGDATPSVARVGLLVEGRRAPREGYPVLHGEESVGVVTSGAPSPTLGRPIAMASVDAATANSSVSLTIDVRGTMIPATVTPLPFYRRA